MKFTFFFKLNYYNWAFITFEARASFIIIEEDWASFIIIIEETQASFIIIVIEAWASLLLLKRSESHSSFNIIWGS
jgi:hypothetical protein